MEQTAIYMNYEELLLTQWALNNLRLMINTEEIKPSHGHSARENAECIALIINKIKAGKDDVLDKERNKMEKERLERDIKEAA